jgi:hypothetical protein
MVCGQMMLFWMTSVFAFELGVHPVLGPVVADEESLPHAAAIASPHASPIPTIHIACFCMLFAPAP